MYLTKDGTPSTGSLVWSDCGDNIVSNLAVSNDPTNSDLKFLTFTVPAANIVQGNAVVAVKDNEGKIMWSWHLWFTDSGALSTTPFNNAAGETQHFTRDNLGFVYDTYKGTSYVTPRRVRVTVTQTGSNEEKQFQIIQNPGTSSISFHDTKYQFGRKDAFSGITTGEPTIVSGWTTYQNSILNPGTFNVFGSSSYTYDWCSTIYYNAWAVDNTSTANSVSTSAITKSVYDPCPVGFKMPGSNAFTGFSKGNGSWAKGYTFTDSSKGTSVFFPAADCRSVTSGKLIYPEQGGEYWSAVPQDKNFSWELRINSDRVDPLCSLNRINGCSVRPVKSN